MSLLPSKPRGGAAAGEMSEWLGALVVRLVDPEFNSQHLHVGSPPSLLQWQVISHSLLVFPVKLVVSLLLQVVQLKG